MGTSSADALGVLTRGDVTIRGRMPGSSNAIFFVDVACDGVTVQAVYKPERGERPLWDFPPGLFRREVAAYALSEALQWGLVPLTVERDGPYGEGSFQLFVEADFAQHYFTLREDSSHAERSSAGRNPPRRRAGRTPRSEEHTSELQSRVDIVCSLLLEKKNNNTQT